jgi:recombination protein RecT
MNQVAKVETRTPAAAFRDQWTRQEQEITAALPPHIPVERFMRVVMTAVGAAPTLLAADRRSLFESAMKAAQDGLLPDGRDGAFVTFRTKMKGDDGKDFWTDKVQWMPMVGGILKKIRNSGELLTISAYVAYEKDEFEYTLGDEESIVHRPCLEDDRGRPRLVYAVAKTKDGGVYREIMTFKDIEKVRGVSKAKDSGPWKDWWDEMAKKTVIRRLAKRLPMSSDLDDLIRRDDDLYDFHGKRADMEDMRRQLQAPNLQDRLREAREASPEPTGEREGFDPSFVQTETSAVLDGEILTDTNTGASSSTPDADEQSPAQSAEADEPPNSSASSYSPETAVLIEFAKSVLPMAAADGTTGAVLAAIEKEWAPEIKKLPAPAQEKAKAISRSMRAIFNNETSMDIAIEFYAEVFGCTVEELGGGNG